MVGGGWVGQFQRLFRDSELIRNCCTDVLYLFGTCQLLMKTYRVQVDAADTLLNPAPPTPTPGVQCWRSQADRKCKGWQTSFLEPPDMPNCQEKSLGTLRASGDDDEIAGVLL